MCPIGATIAHRLGGWRADERNRQYARVHVTIRDVDSGQPPTIRMTASGQAFVASWRGEGRPLPGESYDVELDIHDSLEWGSTVVLDVGQRPHRAGTGLRGRVEDVEGERVVLRVGEGLVLLDVSGDPPMGVVGSTVDVAAERLDVYPTGV